MRVIRTLNTVVLLLLGAGTVVNPGRGEETGAAVSIGAAATVGENLVEHPVGLRAIRLDRGKMAKQDPSAGRATESRGACDVYAFAESDPCNKVPMCFDFTQNPGNVCFSVSPSCGSVTPSCDWASFDPPYYTACTYYIPCATPTSPITVRANPTYGSDQTQTVCWDPPIEACTGGEQHELCVATFDADTGAPAPACIDVDATPSGCGAVAPSYGCSTWDPWYELYVFCSTYSTGSCEEQVGVCFDVESGDSTVYWSFDQRDCSGCDGILQIEILTDGYPEETAWELANHATGALVASGNPGSPNTLYTDCVDIPGCYDFTIVDSYGDGICCDYGNGYYRVYYGDNLVASGGSFGDLETVSEIGDCDTDPPVPDPMTFSSAPHAVSSSAISMTAMLAYDDESPPVEYEFDFTSGGAGGSDGSWRSSRTYTDNGLTPNTGYCYRIRVRDSALLLNTTGWSAIGCAYTLAAVPEAAALDLVDCTSMQIDVVPGGNPPATSFAIECSGSSPYDANWHGRYVSSLGTAQPTRVWRTDAQWGQTQMVGLAPETSYTFRVTARNMDLIPTAAGPSATLTTSKCGDGDWDGDDDVDLHDFASWQRCFGASPLGPECEAGDFNGDGELSYDDLDRFCTAMAGPDS